MLATQHSALLNDMRKRLRWPHLGPGLELHCWESARRLPCLHTLVCLAQRRSTLPNDASAACNAQHSTLETAHILRDAGPGFELDFMLGNCSLSGDPIPTFTCAGPSATFSTTPASFTAKYKSAVEFVGEVRPAEQGLPLPYPSTLAYHMYTACLQVQLLFNVSVFYMRRVM